MTATQIKYDFRSDTVTRPSSGMLAAMMAAKVGDDVYGEDPAINECEAQVAALLGKEAAMFVPSGTMANQIALHLWTRPGEAVICEPRSHIFLYEGGAAAAQSGLQPAYTSGPLTATTAAEAWVGDGPHTPPTTLLVVENTHNMAAGRVTDVAELTRLAAFARAKGMGLHCDGARLWNAAVALGLPEADLAAAFDSVSVCFSKGLGAPVGSVLAGSGAFIHKARRVRKRWGGGMRQAGFLAACASYALEHHRSDLARDHLLAQQFVAAMSNKLEIIYPNPGTNIVFFQAPADPEALVARCGAQGLAFSHLGQGRCRLVWHRDLPEEATGELLRMLTDLI